MKFYYINFPVLDEKGNKISEVQRPFVDFLISYKHNKMVGPIKGLVDSGADYNLFPAEIGEYMKINIKKGKKFATVGIGEKKITTYKHNEIRIYVEGIKIETSIDFSYECEVPLFGQQGFFDKFKKIVFDRKNEEFFLEN